MPPRWTLLGVGPATISSLRAGVAAMGLGRGLVELGLGVVARRSRFGRVVGAVARPVAGLATAMTVALGGGCRGVGMLKHEIHDFGPSHEGGFGWR